MPDWRARSRETEPTESDAVDHAAPDAVLDSLEPLPDEPFEPPPDEPFGLPLDEPAEPLAAIAPPDPEPPTAPASERSALRRLVPMLAFMATVALVGWVIYSGVEGLLRSNALEARIAETQQEISQLQCEADQLAAMVAWLESDEYVERTAREDLGLVRPAEEAFAVHAPPREGLSIVRSPWWANLLHESVCG